MHSKCTVIQLANLNYEVCRSIYVLCVAQLVNLSPCKTRGAHALAALPDYLITTFIKAETLLLSA